MKYHTQWDYKMKPRGWALFSLGDRKKMLRDRMYLIQLGYKVRVLLEDIEIEVEDDDQ